MSQPSTHDRPAEGGRGSQEEKKHDQVVSGKQHGQKRREKPTRGSADHDRRKIGSNQGS
jgi:hypothetical protein